MTIIPQTGKRYTIKIDWSVPVHCLDCKREMRSRSDKTSTLTRHEAHGLCGMCLNKKRRDPATKTPMKLVFDDEGQVCTKCKEYLPYVDFHKASGSSSGYYYQCAKCSLSYRHGITKERYQELLSMFDHKCYICGEPERRTGLSLSLDHDHSCCSSKFSCGDCIRGVLCSDCNRGLGFFRDNPELLLKAHSYLSQTSAV